MELLLVVLLFISSIINAYVCLAIECFVVLQLIPCTLYCFRVITKNEKTLGVLLLILFGIVGYYYGNIEGSAVYYSSGDALGPVDKLPYGLYRWSTYILYDVAFPWIVTFNLAVSPFWSRGKSDQYYIKLIKKRIRYKWEK